MDKEDKELLLKDLSARLPYYPRTKIHIFTKGAHSTKIENLASIEMWKVRNEECQWLINDYLLEDIKPYLRPMSSMTEEEKREYQAFFNYDGVEYSEEYIDWLNKKMFAYRIIKGKDTFELGLALKAPEGMYNIKEK